MSTGYRYLDFDVESATDHRVNDYLKIMDIKPAKNLKDSDKIKKNIAEKMEKIKQQAPLYWYLSRPVTICMYDEEKDTRLSFSDQDPTLLLTKFCNSLVTEYQDHFLCGKNSTKFDMPIVTGWLLKYNIGVPHHFRRNLKALTDIDHIFGYSATMNCQISTLADYAFGLGIDGKTMSGSDVGELYMAYQMGLDKTALDKIIEYCHQDVAIVTEMRKRFFKPFYVKNEPITLEGVF